MTVMTCPDEGTLRAFLDRAADDHASIAEHVRGCLDCRRAVRDLRLNADVAFEALALLDEPAAIPAAIAVGQPYAPIDPPVPGRRWGRLATGAAAVVLTVGLVLTPAGQAVAGGFLNLFHSRSVTAVTLSGGDLNQTAGALSMLGSTTGQWDAQFGPVPSLADAQARVAFRVATPKAADLPTGLGTTPEVSYAKKSSVTVVFDAAQTTTYLQSRGSNLKVPAGFDGEKLTLHFPDAVALTYRGSDDKQLLIVSAGAFEADTEGAMDLAELRDFLVKVPGMPASLANQLGSLDLGAGVLPVPIFIDQMRGTKTTVNGKDAILVQASGLGTAVVWQDKDRLTGIIGSYPVDATLKLAKGLNG